MNVFVSNCVEEKKRKNEKAKKNKYNRSSTIEDLPLLETSTRFRRKPRSTREEVSAKRSRGFLTAMTQSSGTCPWRIPSELKADPG